MRKPPALKVAPRVALSVALSAALLLGGCATTPAVPPLSPAQLVEMSKSMPPEQVIAELRRTNTIFNLNASDIVRLHEAGVAPPVLDYLQRAQVEDMLWRERMLYGPSWGPYGYYGSPFYACPGGLRLRRAPFC
jgi:hypothetical protein